MKIIIFIILILTFILAGCTTPAYVANIHPTPLFKEAYQLHARAGYGLTGFDARAAFSIPVNIFVFGGISSFQADTIPEFKRDYNEGGIGYFIYMDEPILPGILNYNHIEFLAGYGQGNSYGDFSGIIDSFSVKIPADYKKYFIQVNLGYSETSKATKLLGIEYGSSFRLSYVNFYRLNYNGQVISKSFNNLFLECFGFSRIALGPVSIGTAGGVILPFRESEFGGFFLTLNVEAGLNINF